jgi:hypothetical protein
MDIIKVIKIVVLIFLGIAFIYMPLAYLWINRKNRKAKAWAEEHQAVKVYIKRDKMKDELSFRVNGEKPVYFTEGFWGGKIGIYLPAGKNTVDVICSWSYRDVLSPLGYSNHNAGNEELLLTVEVGKQYSICYYHSSEKYVFEEI